MSKIDLELRDAINKEQQHKLKEISMKRIMTYYTPKWMAGLSFLISAIIASSYPIFGLIFGHCNFVFLEHDSPDYLHRRNIWCGAFIGFAIAVGVLAYLQKLIFCHLGENLTYTLRKNLFEGILYKQVSWFDNKERAPGVLTNMLAEDITEINGLTSETISVYLEALLGILIGFIISLCYNWKIALVSIGAAPFVVVGALMMSKTQQRGMGGAKGEDAYKQANALLSDIILNYRTVVSFGDKNINHLINKFADHLLGPNKDSIASAHLTGFFFGYSSFARYNYLAFVFYICGLFIWKFGDDPESSFIAVYVVFISALGCGTQLAHAPSMGKAKDAAKEVFSIIDEESKIDARSEKGVMKVAHGEITIQDVDFRYPSKQTRVLRKLNLTIPANKKIALVGHSGCGKSTITNLLLRFYDVSSGSLKIDGIDIRDYNIAELRRQIGFVMQEPVLFNVSIKDNILYGNKDATDLEVRQVAEQANALQFIESNIEDLNEVDVKKHLEDDFRAKL